MRDLTQRGELLVTFARGASEIVAAELRDLGYSSKPADETARTTEGNLEDVMRLNLWLRAAQRVLMPVASASARDPQELYSAMVAEPWERLLHPDGYISVTASVREAEVRDPRYAALKLKDAIVDRIAKICGRRPDSGGRRDRAVLHLHWAGGVATVSIDTSGEPLSRRGYRLQPGRAPMQESLAAACILASPWRGSTPFVNPMCGSGTLAIEAALIASNRAPGLLRDNFGFFHVRGFREREWKRLKSDARAGITRITPPCEIIASDISPRAVEAARANAERAEVAVDIRFEVCDFADTTIPPSPGVIFLNPEYGERLGDAEALAPVYTRIGDFLKQRCTGYVGYVFTANLALAKRIGLRSRRRLAFFNANLEGRLLEFELYAGSRKATSRPER
ncbi:MAG: class I SAM-dependent RNA methyltransferase [Kiritimatiellae bacterium]|nr:class I SAM-dependent RNA methyltransferase [Kiritimatiellia bacterium]MDW8458105.1 class I SAM-dependent RNA methyltransferase [Verrucomicrobiota bacterium]